MFEVNFRFSLPTPPPSGPRDAGLATAPRAPDRSRRAARPCAACTRPARGRRPSGSWPAGRAPSVAGSHPTASATILGPSAPKSSRVDSPPHRWHTVRPQCVSRLGLWRWRLTLGHMIRSFGPLPLQRPATGTRGIRGEVCLKLLLEQQATLVSPERTRGDPRPT